MKKHTVKNTILAAAAMACFGAHADMGNSKYLLVAPMVSVSEATANIDVALASTAAIEAVVGDSVRLDVRSLLNVTGDPGFGLEGVSWKAGSLPAGLSHQGGVIEGVVEQVGVNSVSMTARYKLKNASQTYAIHGFKTVVADIIGAYVWSDGSLASSCLEYLRPGPDTFARAAAAIDGIYRVTTPSGPVDVLCDMTRDGGGWTMITKQAQGDGITLQGDTAYWTQGVTLNDTRASLNKNSGNYMSALYASLPVTDFRLEVSNEATRKFETKSAPVTPISAFSNAAATRYSDDVGTAGTVVRPNWSLYATQYQNNVAITSARFGFNHAQFPTSVIVDVPNCATRWGWTLNQDSVGLHLGTHDTCAGLGAYGAAYGSAMNPNKNTFQTATFYLWVR